MPVPIARCADGCVRWLRSALCGVSVRAAPLAFALALSVALELASRPALAQAPQAAHEPARVHDGFYFRVASGFALYDERLRSNGPVPERNGRSRGIAALSELAVGGTVAHGWVIGGGIYVADLAASTYRSTSELPPLELDPGLRNVAVIGPFFDRYFDPTGGLHLQVALGLATLAPRVFGHDATEQSEYLALGVGLMFGVGQEFWIGDSWSLGVLARTTVSLLQGEDETNLNWQHLAVTSPGLMVTLTYH